MSKPSCVIVGAGPGLGFSLARRFARGGFEAALVGRKQGRLDRLAEALIAEGHGARGFAADAGDEAALTAAFGRIAAWNGDVGVLIYNAADMAADSVTAMTPGVMMARMAANLGGAITSVNRVLPAMRDRGAGTILITGGGLALEPYPDWAALSAGKAALRGYAIALHKALAPEGIHVAVVAVCGIVEAGGAFDPDLIAEAYWGLHEEARPGWRRELVYLPKGADPYYNDPGGLYRATSLPIAAGRGS